MWSILPLRGWPRVGSQFQCLVTGLQIKEHTHQYHLGIPKCRQQKCHPKIHTHVPGPPVENRVTKRNRIQQGTTNGKRWPRCLQQMRMLNQHQFTPQRLPLIPLWENCRECQLPTTLACHGRDVRQGLEYPNHHLVTTQAPAATYQEAPTSLSISPIKHPAIVPKKLSEVKNHTYWFFWTCQSLNNPQPLQSAVKETARSWRQMITWKTVQNKCNNQKNTYRTLLIQNRRSNRFLRRVGA